MYACSCLAFKFNAWNNFCLRKNAWNNFNEINCQNPENYGVKGGTPQDLLEKQIQGTFFWHDGSVMMPYALILSNRIYSYMCPEDS